MPTPLGALCEGAFFEKELFLEEICPEGTEGRGGGVGREDKRLIVFVTVVLATSSFPSIMTVTFFPNGDNCKYRVLIS